jgi:transcriptional regulator with XRE-family HTH domain
MAPKGRGGGVTPARVVEEIRKAVSGKSVRAISKETGLGLAQLSRYMNGIGEPTAETLRKLADYFECPIEWLRGETYVDLWGEEYGDDLTEDQKEELSYEYWRKRAEETATAPVMVEIVRCLSRVPQESRNTAFAVFRHTCRMVEALSRDREAMIQLAEELRKLSPACECQNKEVNL